MKSNPEQIDEMQSHLNEFNINDVLIYNLIERVKNLEEKVFKNKKPPITLNQQIIALETLGMLQKIRELNISAIKKADLLAAILKTDKSNTKKAMEALARRGEKLVKTPLNYEYLAKLFEDVGLLEKCKEMENYKRKIEIK
jgi:hypothetical protein